MSKDKANKVNKSDVKNKVSTVESTKKTAKVKDSKVDITKKVKPSLSENASTPKKKAAQNLASKKSPASKKSVAKKAVIKKNIPQETDMIVHDKKMVILQILPELKSGGVERGTIEIAKAGASMGHEMLVASNGGHLVGQLESEHINHIKLPLASKNPFIIINNIRRIKKIIKKYKVDIVHARSRAPAWSAYFAAKQSGCHFVTTFHGTYSCGSSLKKLYNSVMTKGEVVIAISDFIKNHLINDYEVNPEKITVVSRGADLEQFTRNKVHNSRIINTAAKYCIEPDAPVILLPGRFTRWKGQSFLIDALALLEDEKFSCVFAGYDKKHKNYYDELEKKIKEKGLFNKISMIGEVNDMPALYSLADIVVSASVNPEAFGRVAIEGQAMEKLVVATNHGGSVETVKHGKTGWLVEPDDVNGLAETLRELLHIDDKKRKTVISGARKNIENNFSTEAMVNKTFNVYKNILG
jgi:glycosyltransferase involved in cell wall biosynthesis